MAATPAPVQFSDVPTTANRRRLFESPFARFNLWRNPFGELTREERADLAVVDIQQYLAGLSTATAALQFMGKKGTGKTTHLLALQRSLRNASYVYLPEDGSQSSIPNSRPLLIDEAQRLHFRQRLRVFGLGGPLVLGTHQDFSEELRRSGLEVVHVEVDADRSPERLSQILNARIEASRVSNSPVPRIEVQYASRLLRDQRRSIRDIEQSLYVEFQNAIQTGLPWPPAT